MQADDMKKAAIQVASLMERLSRASQEMSQSSKQATEHLQHAAQAAPAVLRQAADEALKELSANTVKAVHHGLNGPLDGFNRQVLDQVNRINGVMYTLDQAQQRMASTARKLALLVASVIATMLLVVVAGSGLLWHYKTVIAQNQISAELMQAFNQADVRFCGDRLCARVDKSDKRFGDYVPLKPR
jgi:hypothetical protein